MHRVKDVVIIGGGPAGLYTGHLLAEQGWDVLLLDGRRAIGEQVVCTGIVSKEAFTRFRFSSSCILSKIQRLRLVSPSGFSLDYNHPEVLAYTVDRNKFDNQIREWTQKSGAEVRLRSTVKEVNVSRNHIEIFVASPNKSYRVRAALVVLATGVSYHLHRQLGLSVPVDYWRGAQTHLAIEYEGPTIVFVGQQVAPGGFAWVVPLQKGLCRVGLVTEGPPRVYFQRLLSRLDRNWHQKGIRLDFKPIAQGLLPRTYSNRVIAVGEAAGQIKTTTGGGICYGLMGAEIAAQVVNRSLKHGTLSSKSLREYDQCWKHQMGREIKLGYWARRLAGRLTDGEITKVIQAIQGDGFFAFAERNARFDWHRDMIFYMLHMPVVRNIVMSVLPRLDGPFRKFER